MPDIYDDPAFKEEEMSDFPVTLKFNVPGDRVRGVVTEIAKFEPRGQKPALKYVLAEVVAKQQGVQGRYDIVEIIAGSKNLKGQLITLKPRKGDQLDIELTELRPSQFASPTKIYEISVVRAEGGAGLAIVNGGDGEDDDEEDLFA